MNIVAVIQARTGSTRLPGKVLSDVAGKTMLERVIDRAVAIDGIDGIGVATSGLPGDDAIERICHRLAVPVFRGSEQDVLARYVGAAREWNAGAIVRITADCPLLDSRIVGLLVSIFRAGSSDYVSNIHPRTFPDGLDAEVVSTTALEKAFQQASFPSDREHVTPFIWRQPNLFSQLGMVRAPSLSHLRWTVDTPDDLSFVQSIFQAAPDSALDLDGVLNIIRNPHESGAARRADRTIRPQGTLDRDRVS